MLTENEREWLVHRDAMQFLIGTYIADFAEYPLWNSGKDWQESAEFEARVAAKLAEIFDESTEIAPLCPSCPCEENCYDGHLDCASAILKFARLAVEEEIDG